MIKFDNKVDKMNSLGEQVMQDMNQIKSEVLNNPNITSAVIISGKPDNFIVGADIRMLEKIKTQVDAERMIRGLL